MSDSLLTCKDEDLDQKLKNNESEKKIAAFYKKGKPNKSQLLDNKNTIIAADNLITGFSETEYFRNRNDKHN
jgi:hypothetical protein